MFASPAAERTVPVSVYRSPTLTETFEYRENFSVVHTDVWQCLRDRGYNRDTFRDLISRDAQSVVIGVPTCRTRKGQAFDHTYPEKILYELALVKADPAFADWKVELVYNVNGLRQEEYLRDVLGAQKSLTTNGIPFTVLHMPLGGRQAGDILSGKGNAMNSVADYARMRGASILGFMDDDVHFQTGNIRSNLRFLLDKARMLEEPVLVGSQWRISNSSIFSRVVSPALEDGPHSVLGPSMFTFLESFPKIPSYPFNDDYYLNWYFVDSSKPLDEARWRIHANGSGEARIGWRVAQSWPGAIRQALRWEYGDQWVHALLDEKKQNMRMPHGGLALLQDYISGVTDVRRRQESSSVLGFAATFPKFLIRQLFINHWVGLEMYVREKLNWPRTTTGWATSVPAESKDGLNDWI